MSQKHHLNYYPLPVQQALTGHILQILSVTLFEKVPILQALEASGSQDDLVRNPNQLILFEF